MAMTFFLHDSIQPDGPFDLIDRGSGEHGDGIDFAHGEFPLLREKLAIPAINGLIQRPRLSALLTKSREQFPATLISGRAGTGKTAIAAQFASTAEKACWYTVEATDIDWPVFSRYVSACLSGIGFVDPEIHSTGPRGDASQSAIARFLLRHFFRSETESPTGPALIVLDDIHHIFDAPWFEEFFYLLLYSLPPDAHLLMLCRSKPPAPMWRLRSKQMLNVLDEKVIAFDVHEAEALSTSIGVSASRVERARRDSFGRISKLLQLAQ